MPRQALPPDDLNQVLIQDIYPSDWKNPQPKETYDLVIIGGGPSGMTAATIAPGLNARVAIIGAGPIGCELSQAFLRFGSRVTLITRGAHLLPRDDCTANERLQRVFEKEGMQILLETQIKHIEKKRKEKILYLDTGKAFAFDQILVAVGRVPNVKELGLKKAGVIYDLKDGVASDDTLKTSNPDIYILGDIGWRYRFTHISKELGKMAVQNALKAGKEKRSSMVVPWSTYSVRNGHGQARRRYDLRANRSNGQPKRDHLFCCSNPSIPHAGRSYPHRCSSLVKILANKGELSQRKTA
jgi:pyruvate/2-oxoglutarate dehydrogenase complex dihydrolipoamide dehydrogenase (E3) component